MLPNLFRSPGFKHLQEGICICPPPQQRHGRCLRWPTLPRTDVAALCPVWGSSHLDRLGNSASGTIAATHQTDTAEPHPFEVFLFSCCEIYLLIIYFGFSYTSISQSKPPLYTAPSNGHPSRLLNFGMAPGGPAAGAAGGAVCPGTAYRETPG